MTTIDSLVVLVTTEYGSAEVRTSRGLTVSSFTTICLTPSPFICFSTRQSSRAADLIAVRRQFVVHLLASTTESAKIAEAFSKSDLAPHAGSTTQDPFKLGQWTRDRWELPVLDGVMGALLCKVDRTVDVGDHRLCIAEVEDMITHDSKGTALGYCERSYRKEGRRVFPHDPGEEED